MPLAGLNIIGESINDSVPSTHKLYEADDLEGIKALARFQDERGAAYVDVNVGQRPPAFLAQVIREVQRVTTKPLSIDTPDVEMAEAALKAYDSQRSNGIIPVLNSISPLRAEMFDLLKIQPFAPILLVTERLDAGQGSATTTVEQTHATARELSAQARSCGVRNADIIIDPGIAPIGADSEGNIHRLMGALEGIHTDPELAGVHMSVGLSNFTVMLPPKRASGGAVKSALESAFLTRAMPLGLDYVIGSVKRKYRLLEEGDPALVCLDEVLGLHGFDVIMRVQEFYSG